MNTQSETLKYTELFSNCSRLEIFAEKNKDLFTKAQLKWLIRNRDENGLTEFQVLLKISGKIYVNEPNMANWVASQVA